MSNSDSIIGRQPKPEGRDASTPPPEPSQDNDWNGRGKQQSPIDPSENIAEAPPVSKVAEPASDGQQVDEVPGLSGTDLVPAALAADAPVPERQQVVSFGAGPTRRPPALRDCVRALPEVVVSTLHVGRDQDDEPFLQLDGRSIVHRLRDAGTRVILAQAMIAADGSVRPAELQSVIDEIEGYARLYGQRQHVWVGVAPNDEGGVDLDLADDEQTIARVVPGRHYLITDGTTTLFYRTPRMLRRLWSKSGGDFYRLFRYLKNLRFQDQRLIAAWVLYILAHPKAPATVFIHLILVGPQGSGKTLLAEMLMSIISPSSVGRSAAASERGRPRDRGGAGPPLRVRQYSVDSAVALGLVLPDGHVRRRHRSQALQ